MKPEWKIIALNKFGTHVYFEQLILPSIKVRVNYYPNPSKNMDGDFDFVSILGTVSGGIEDANLMLNGLEAENLYDEYNNFSNDIIMHYKNEVISNIRNILGSVKAFGNPAKLFRDVNTGLTSFKKFNVLEGTGQVVTGGIGGAVGIFGNVTGGIANTVSLLSFDQKYVEERNYRKKNKPKNMLQGMGQGVAGIGGGIVDGLTGVVMNPIQGAKESGFGGFFKGVGKGITGLFVKPVTGVIDGISKTAEGVQNTVHEELNDQVRSRRIRAFYGFEQKIKNFNDEDAIFQHY